MKPYYEDASVTLYHGDCLEVLADLPDASVDSVVTDPPYGLGFMGKAWDAEFIGSTIEKRRQYAGDPSSKSGENGGYRSAAAEAGRYDLSLTGNQSFGAWCEQWTAECLRVLKPGGHLLAFGGTRTWHRLAVAVEDAGFEIRDSIAWMYGSGFPKSLDVSKAIDKSKTNGANDIVVRGCAWIADRVEAEGISKRDLDALAGTSDMGGWWASRLAHRCALPTAEQWERIAPLIGDPPEWLAPYILPANTPGEAWQTAEVVGVRTDVATRIYDNGEGPRLPDQIDVKAANSDAAREWQGWGTALKPAFEPIVVARKPLAGTVAANVLAHGAGALNIDGARVATDEDRSRPPRTPNTIYGGGNGTDLSASESNPSGRWPANVILDESQAAALDEQSGYQKDGVAVTRNRAKSYEASAYQVVDASGKDKGYGGGGGASRFFYTAKADASERPKVNGTAHPTVKPLSLMRWLVRLVTPPGGTVLEPFAGSGTTVEACILERFNVVAIEREADYLPLITQRINRRRDPVAYSAAAGEDMGLFGLIEEEPA